MHSTPIGRVTKVSRNWRPCTLNMWSICSWWLLSRIRITFHETYQILRIHCTLVYHQTYRYSLHFFGEFISLEWIPVLCAMRPRLRGCQLATVLTSWCICSLQEWGFVSKLWPLASRTGASVISRATTRVKVVSPCLRLKQAILDRERGGRERESERVREGWVT